MNESEIRARVRVAIGETTYPPALRESIAGRLGAPTRREHSTVMALVAATVALAIVATLVLVRTHTLPRTGPAATPTTHVSPPPQVSPPSTPPLVSVSRLPAADLAAAGLNASTAALVTPMALSSTSNGRVVTLIGAYADSARTVVFFRTAPPVGFPHVTIYDDQGVINAGSGTGVESFGDSFRALDAGPRAGPDGTANLRVVLNDFEDGLDGPRTSGPWSFSFALKITAPTPLTLTPPLRTVGSWKFTVEAFEASPTVIRFRATIDGASVQEILDQPITLVDDTGRTVNVISSGAGAIKLTALPVNVSWFRPAMGGTFTLNISGGGGVYSGQVSIPPVAAASPLKGAPIIPTDFPTSGESLRIDGLLSTAITHGFPSQCGPGAGASGALFAFATWFEVDNRWYLIVFSTDPKLQQYRGPGTYPGTSTIYPYAAFGADPIFTGTVELTVASDTSPDAGSVRGTLDWVGSSAGSSRITVSGDWSCTPSPALGPG